MGEDVGGKAVARAVLLCAPLQHFLSAAFNNETVVGNLRRLCLATSPHHTADSHLAQSIEELREEAACSNWQILSGARGQEVVNEYTSLLMDFESDASKWKHLRLAREAQLAAAPEIMLAICSPQRADFAEVSNPGSSCGDRL